MPKRRQRADVQVHVKSKGGEVKPESRVKMAETALLQLELTAHQGVQFVFSLAGFEMPSS